jgi:hypothetical protein
MEIFNEIVKKKLGKYISKRKWIKENFSDIQFIFAESMSIYILPNWLQMCQKTQVLNLSDNNIKDISVL